MKIKSLILLLLLPVVLYSQSIYSKYNWTTMPEPVYNDSIKSADGAAIMLERRITEVYANKQQLFEETYVYHKKIKVETHDAINNFNKIYIQLNNVLDIIDIAARFISPNGKITTLSKSSIKQIDNLENKGNFKTFVIEGAEMGGQIEYYYVLRKNFDPYGGYYVQDETPRANVEVYFIYPDKLIYMFRSNNGFPEFTAETKDGVTTQKVSIQHIEGIKEEQYAYYKPNLMSFDFTLAYNKYLSYVRTYSWSKACDNLYNNLYVTTKKEKTAVQKLYDKIGITASNNETKIRQIENWIKGFFKVDRSFQNQPDLTQSIKLHQCSFSEISKLYIALFQIAGIDFEYVKTGDKSVQSFKPDYDAFNYMDYSLFYFPEIEKYITPEDLSYRLGTIPGEFQDEYGLFMKPIEYNETLKTLGYEIKKIHSQPCTVNADSLIINVTLDLQNQLLNTNTKRVMMGDFGRSFQSMLHLLDDTKKKEMVETLFEMGREQTEVLRINYTNSAPENIGIKPLVWDLDLQSKSLIENAGTDFLIKIGETIGRQSELYQEHKRVLPINIDILHDYYRLIKVTIPEGYYIDNLGDLNMHVELKKDGRTGCIFTSEASVSNNILTIVSKEYYNDYYYPVTRYDEFRKVINAAADFNKKSLLLRKK